MLFELIVGCISFFVVFLIFSLNEYHTEKKVSFLANICGSLFFTPIVFLFLLAMSVIMFEPKGYVEYSEVNIHPLPGETKYIEKTDEVYLVYRQTSTKNKYRYSIIDKDNIEIIKGKKETKLIKKTIAYSHSFWLPIFLKDKVTYKLYLK
jgi:hypothetical protein